MIFKFDLISIGCISLDLVFILYFTFIVRYVLSHQVENCRQSHDKLEGKHHDKKES